MRIVCIDGEAQYADIVNRDVAEPLRAAGHVFDWFEERFDDPEAATRRASGYDALYVVGDQGPVPTGLLDATPSLRLVSFVGTGARRFVDIARADALGITVTNVPDFASASVAELSIALMFAVARGIPRADSTVRAGRWQKDQGLKLAGRTLGVVGAGRIAAGVISRGAGLGMRTLYWSRTHSADRDRSLGASFVELSELFARSDVVSINIAHTPETDGLIDAGLLGLLKQRSILVNTARAEVIDNGALFALLASGSIFGAGLDVFLTEPPDVDSLPLAANLVLTPMWAFTPTRPMTSFG